LGVSEKDVEGEEDPSSRRKEKDRSFITHPLSPSTSRSRSSSHSSRLRRSSPRDEPRRPHIKQSQLPFPTLGGCGRATCRASRASGSEINTGHREHGMCVRQSGRCDINLTGHPGEALTSSAAAGAWGPRGPYGGSNVDKYRMAGEGNGRREGDEATTPSPPARARGASVRPISPSPARGSR